MLIRLCSYALFSNNNKKGCPFLRLFLKLFFSFENVWKINITFNAQRASSNNSPPTLSQRVLNDLWRTMFSRRHMIWLLPHHLPTYSSQHAVSLSQSSCVLPVELTEGRECGGVAQTYYSKNAWSSINHFNTLCRELCLKGWMVGTFVRRSDGLICDICHKIYPNRNALRQVDPSA